MLKRLYLDWKNIVCGWYHIEYYELSNCQAPEGGESKVRETDKLLLKSS